MVAARRVARLPGRPVADESVSRTSWRQLLVCRRARQTVEAAAWWPLWDNVPVPLVVLVAEQLADNLFDSIPGVMHDCLR